MSSLMIRTLCGNVSNKGRELIVQNDNVSFNTGMGGTVPRDDCCAGVCQQMKHTSFTAGFSQCYLVILRQKD